MAAFCEVDGYKVIAVQCPALHYLYMRAHEGKVDDAELPAGRTLFIANVPLEFTQETLRALFRPRGKVHRVTISSRASQKHHNAAARRLYHASSTDDYTMFAHIVFKDPASLASALAVDTNAPPALASSTTMRPCGVDAWLDEHRSLFPNRRALQAEVDQSVAAYEEAEAKRKKAREAARVADDEGWTTVVYGRKRADIEGAAKDVKKKKKPDPMLNFYRWQQREQRRDQIAELRRKFEEDKQRIAVMRMSRKFRPY